MFVAVVLSGLLLIASNTSAQDVPSVPTGTPIPGDYTGALRPQIHYSPPKEFMVA